MERVKLRMGARLLHVIMCMLLVARDDKTNNSSRANERMYSFVGELNVGWCGENCTIAQHDFEESSQMYRYAVSNVQPRRALLDLFMTRNVTRPTLVIIAREYTMRSKEREYGVWVGGHMQISIIMHCRTVAHCILIYVLSVK